MNYLAHAYLSFNDPEILLGNMISDYVKGRKQYDYNPRTYAGIRLHRAIDEFTDAHAITHEIKTIFKPTYGLYSGALMDVIYDHFLARDPNIFTDETLLQFSLVTYDQLDSFEPEFPEKFRRIFPHMRSHNWLYGYRSITGVERSLGGLVHRAKYLHESDTAFRIFLAEFDAIGQAYQAFFPELYKFALSFYDDLNR